MGKGEGGKEGGREGGREGTDLTAGEDGAGLLLAFASAASAGVGRVAVVVGVGVGFDLEAVARFAAGVVASGVRVGRAHAHVVVHVVRRVVVRVATDVDFAVGLRVVVICSPWNRQEMHQLG